jgi:L-threonylcarbamoyladenylate synthase
MPTETVYGLAADALNPAAVRATFAAKGRPADNPLIVHVLDLEGARRVAREIPEAAAKLAEAFWPGPLTLVLPKRPEVPAEVTAGLDTVAVRVPAHPVARALLKRWDGPLTAPSANLFSGLSPTRPEHLEPRLLEHVALVLDGGACEVGIESTVLDLTVDPPRILRPGGVGRSEIERVLGKPVGLLREQEDAGRSPGTFPRHYSPRTPLVLVDRLSPDQAGLTFSAPQNKGQIQLPADPPQYARRLYDALHTLDKAGFPALHVESPPRGDEWESVWDRLRRAMG